VNQSDFILKFELTATNAWDGNGELRFDPYLHEIHDPNSFRDILCSRVIEN
jgi:hypothetical protein